MTIKDFRGQVKISDVQNAFDEIIQRINAQVDIYNGLYELQDYDITKGSPLLGASTYSLSVGGLKSVLNSYAGTVIGCKAFKVDDEHLLITDGFYITPSQVYRINQRVIRAGYNGGMADFDNSGMTIDEDTHIATQAYNGGYIYTDNPFTGIDANEIDSFEIRIVCEFLANQGSLSYLQLESTVEGTASKNKVLCACQTASGNSRTSLTLTIVDPYQNPTVYDASAPSSTKLYYRVKFVKGTGYSYSKSLDGTNWTNIGTINTVTTFEFAGAEGDLIKIGQNCSKLYLDECYVKVNDNTVWAPYGVYTGEKEDLYYNYITDEFFTKNNPDYTEENVIKISALNWTANDILLTSINNLQIEGSGVKLYTQDKYIPCEGHVWESLDTSSSGKFVSYVSRNITNAGSTNAYCKFMDVVLLNSYNSESGLYRKHWCVHPISLIYIPNGFIPNVVHSGSAGQYVYDYTLESE